MYQSVLCNRLVSFILVSCTTWTDLSRVHWVWVILFSCIMMCIINNHPSYKRILMRILLAIILTSATFLPQIPLTDLNACSANWKNLFYLNIKIISEVKKHVDPLLNSCALGMYMYAYRRGSRKKPSGLLESEHRIYGSPAANVFRFSLSKFIFPSILSHLENLTDFRKMV